MTRTHFKKFIFLVLMAIWMTSCQEEDVTLPNSEETKENVSALRTAEPEKFSTDGLGTPMVLGRKLDDPYTVANMTKAWNTIKANYPANAVNVRTTHLYIRFAPKDEEEMMKLEDDSTLFFASYPVDYEILKEGDYYQDPSIPLDKPTYQYASVKSDYKFPEGIQYEVLANLYLPQEDRQVGESLATTLEDKALQITGNEDPKDEAGQGERRSKWRGKGRIRIWDNETNAYRGMEAVEVCLRRWHSTRRGYTDANGYYTINGPRFRRKARYIVRWKRYQFSIKSSFFYGAKHRGPRRKGDWNWDINTTTRQHHFAAIFRPAYHYYYKNIKGLRRPPQNKWYRRKIRIRATTKHSNTAGVANPAGHIFGGAWIKINNPNENVMNTYATVTHELSHASHWKIDKWGYTCGSNKVAESWARGVQWELTRMVYPYYRGGSNHGDYTSLVLDMIDSHYPNYNPNWGWNDSRDQVEGYTIRQIEDALKDCDGKWAVWNNLIKERYNNATEEHLDRLFDLWLNHY